MGDGLSHKRSTSIANAFDSHFKCTSQLSSVIFMYCNPSYFLVWYNAESKIQDIHIVVVLFAKKQWGTLHQWCCHQGEKLADLLAWVVTLQMTIAVIEEMHVFVCICMYFYVFVFILHKVLQNQNHHRVPTIRDHTDCCLFYFLRRSTISWVPRILSNASTIAMLVALVPAKDLHIFNICRILEKEGELDPWKLIPHLRFRRNVPLVSLPHLEILSKAEVVGQIQDKVWRTLKCVPP